MIFPLGNNHIGLSDEEPFAIEIESFVGPHSACPQCHGHGVWGIGFDCGACYGWGSPTLLAFVSELHEAVCLVLEAEAEARRQEAEEKSRLKAERLRLKRLRTPDLFLEVAA